MFEGGEEGYALCGQCVCYSPCPAYIYGVRFVGRMADYCRIKDINTNCLDQFNAHWGCLENNNHRMFECRGPEMKLNNCVFEKLVCRLSSSSPSDGIAGADSPQGLKKTIPGTPEGQTPVHLRPKQLNSIEHSGPQW